MPADNVSLKLELWTVSLLLMSSSNNFSRYIIYDIWDRNCPHNLCEKCYDGLASLIRSHHLISSTNRIVENWLIISEIKVSRENPSEKLAQCSGTPHSSLSSIVLSHNSRDISCPERYKLIFSQFQLYDINLSSRLLWNAINISNNASGTTGCGCSNQLPGWHHLDQWNSSLCSYTFNASKYWVWLIDMLKAHICNFWLTITLPFKHDCVVKIISYPGTPDTWHVFRFDIHFMPISQTWAINPP